MWKKSNVCKSPGLLDDHLAAGRLNRWRARARQQVQDAVASTVRAGARSGVDPERDDLGFGLLDGFGRRDDVVPVLGLPRQFDPGLLQDRLVVVQTDVVLARADGVDLAVDQTLVLDDLRVLLEPRRVLQELVQGHQVIRSTGTRQSRLTGTAPASARLTSCGSQQRQLRQEVRLATLDRDQIHRDVRVQLLDTASSPESTT